jgi:hypothetical protein
MIDDAQLMQMVGRGAAAGEYWSLLAGGVILSALCAPQLIEARRSTLLLAQPISRADTGARNLRLRLPARACPAR